MKITRPGIIVLLLIAFGLRLVNLDQSLWLDEAINVRAATNFDPLYLVANYSLGDFHPPIYHLILHYWIKLYNNHEIWVRLPSVIFGLVTIYYTFLISLRVFTQKTFTLAGKKFKWAYLPAVLLSTSSLHIYYSQEARMYSFAAMAVAMSVYYVYERVGNQDIWSLRKYFRFVVAQTKTLKTPNSIWLIISLWLLLMSDYLAYFVLPILGILAPLPLIIALVLSGWWLPLFWVQLNQGLETALDYPLWGQVVGGLSLKNILLIPVKFLIGRVSISPQWLYGLVAAALTLISSGLILLGIRSLWHGLKSQKNLLLITWLILPLVIGIAAATKVSLLSYFRFLFILPIFYLLIVIGLSRVKQSWAKILVFIYLATNIISTTAYYTQPQFQREDWRAFSNWIEMQDHAQAVTVFPNLAQADPYLYYQSEVQVVDDLDMIDYVPSNIYLVRYVQEIFDPADKLRQEIESMDYVIVEQKNFNGVVVWHYQPNRELFALTNAGLAQSHD